MNFYKELELVLLAGTPNHKIELFKKFYKAYKKGEVEFEKSYTPIDFTKPSYESFCTVVAPQKVPKRSNLTTKEGQINLLHAVAHIEYSAIDLALDAAYRFQSLPKEYYDDWLEVADDEVRHFKMLHTLLEELGAKYGDVAVHNSLFEASQKTQHSFLERMAVVPRYLEANGLDATPMILQKLQNYPRVEFLQKIKEKLYIILAEEIDHVKKGDRWFRYACKQQNKPQSIYFEIIYRYYPRGFLRPDDLNIKARKEAGFTCNELKQMANKEVC
ncbi:MAG: ferritin-like domain-containing protein [Epsilonproteobacteria bacterium]|nr:ferritin-like domain-containing protein [Campylobacterota bacterium]